MEKECSDIVPSEIACLDKAESESGRVYERPELQFAGKFSKVTRGSGSTVSFDFYLTDYP